MGSKIIPGEEPVRAQTQPVEGKDPIKYDVQSATVGNQTYNLFFPLNNGGVPDGTVIVEKERYLTLLHTGGQDKGGGRIYLLDPTTAVKKLTNFQASQPNSALKVYHILAESYLSLGYRAASIRLSNGLRHITHGGAWIKNNIYSTFLSSIGFYNNHPVISKSVLVTLTVTIVGIATQYLPLAYNPWSKFY